MMNLTLLDLSPEPTRSSLILLALAIVGLVAAALLGFAVEDSSMAADAAFDRKGQTMKADRTSAADRARFVLIASTPPSRSHRSAGTRKPILGFNNKDECGAVLSGEESQNLFVGLSLW